MGICGGGEDEVAIDPDKRRNSRVMDRRLADRASAAASLKTILTLGAGESGKSTVFKQVKLLHAGGYSASELRQFRWIIHRNVLDAIKTLLTQVQNMELELDESLEDISDRIMLWDGENLNPELGDGIAALWKDNAVQTAFQRRAEFQLGDGASYFLDRVMRVCQDEFLPTVDDMLRARVRTSGVVAKDFSINSSKYRMYDVGGQRSERRRWIQYFDHVTAIVFVAAISEYNQVMAEDKSKNRLEEAIELFEQIVNSHHFKV